MPCDSVLLAHFRRDLGAQESEEYVLLQMQWAVWITLT